nr:MBL fold metallo-hydrolase [uncultured Blautia sp.]
MKIITLIENTCGEEGCLFEHGLSLYIETQKHKIVLDTGSSDAFIQNAGKLGVDLEAVDTVVLSHGHYDHSGGILAFAEINPRALIYMQKTAGADYFHGERYIGIDKKILELPEVRLIEGGLVLDDQLSLFTHITGRRYYPQSNLALTVKRNGIEVKDSFDHEQCLVIREGEERILVSGCAHNGILNILDKYRELYHELPKRVISGFHMMKKTPYTKEEQDTILANARELAGYDIIFYTGHCTGDEAFELMKPIMGEKLVRLRSGIRVM